MNKSKENKKNEYISKLDYYIDESKDTSISEEKVQDLYKNARTYLEYSGDIIINLAGNPATPHKIQEEIMKEFIGYKLAMSFINNPNKSRKAFDEFIKHIKKANPEMFQESSQATIEYLMFNIAKSKNINKHYKEKILTEMNEPLYKYFLSIIKHLDMIQLYSKDQKTKDQIEEYKIQNLEKFVLSDKKDICIKTDKDFLNFDEDSFYNFLKHPDNIKVKIDFNKKNLEKIINNIYKNNSKQYLNLNNLYFFLYNFDISEPTIPKDDVQTEILLNATSKEEKIKIATTSNDTILLNKLAEENDLEIKMAIAANENINIYTVDHLMYDVIKNKNGLDIKGWIKSIKDDEILFDILMQNKSVSILSLNSLVLNMSNRTLKTEFTLDFDIKKETNHYKEDKFYMAKSSLEKLLKIMPKNMLWYYLEELSTYDNQLEKIDYINAILKNPNIDKDIIKYIYFNDKELIFPDKDLFLEKGLTKDDYYDFLYECKKIHDIIIEINNNPDMSEKTLKKFSQINNEDIAISIINHKHCTEEMINELSSFNNTNINKYIVKNTNNEQIINKLIIDEDPTIRKEIVKNINLNEKQILKLAEDKNSEVRLELSQNPRITPTALGILLNDENDYVRNSAFLNPKRKLVVVANEKTPTSLLLEYAKSDDPEILAEIVKNPNCTQEIVNEILKNKILENEFNKNIIIKTIDDIIYDKEKIQNEINKEKRFSKLEKEKLKTALKENKFNQLIEEYTFNNEEKAKILNSIINSSKKFTIPEKEKVETLVK